MVGRKRPDGRGTGEAYLVLSLVVGSFVQEHLRHFHTTIISGDDQSSPTVLSETDTHSERERPRDDTAHHPQTLMQRDMAYMDTQTCNSGLHSALLHVCMHNTHYR